MLIEVVFVASRIEASRTSFYKTDPFTSPDHIHPDETGDNEALGVWPCRFRAELRNERSRQQRIPNRWE